MVSQLRFTKTFLSYFEGRPLQLQAVRALLFAVFQMRQLIQPQIVSVCRLNRFFMVGYKFLGFFNTRQSFRREVFLKEIPDLFCSDGLVVMSFDSACIPP